MKIRYSAAITDLDNTPIKEGDKEITLGVVAARALLSSHQEDAGLPGEDKVHRFHLAQIATQEKDVELKAEDVALLKKLIAREFAPLVVGRVYDLIELPE